MMLVSDAYSKFLSFEILDYALQLLSTYQQVRQHEAVCLCLFKLKKIKLYVILTRIVPTDETRELFEVKMCFYLLKDLKD